MIKLILRNWLLVQFLIFIFQAEIHAQPVFGVSPITEPYPYVSNGSFSGPLITASPDPLVSYRWPEVKATDGLEIYIMKPVAVSSDNDGSFENLNSLTGDSPLVTVNGTGSLKIDFGVECAAWIEFDTPDCQGDVEMSISEYNEKGFNKTKVPVKYGNTYRLELNDELYEGMRFGWIDVKSCDKEWHITGIRAVCQVKPTNYNGSFSCDDSLLNRIWYVSAYSVKAAQCENYFGAILMDRGDRMSWTGDAHTTQAAALVAFSNYDFIKKNIDNTAVQDNGIKSYALYWVLSLIDYYYYTGDTVALRKYVNNACAKLDSAYKWFGTDPNLRYYGWDERLCAGFEIWFKPSPECQNAYKMLSVRTWREFASAMEKYGRYDLRDKYNAYAKEKIESLRKEKNWLCEFGLHSAADAVTTELLSEKEQNFLYNKHFTDRVNRVSYSPFNQYFIIQAMAEMGKYDDALSSIRDLWGGMVKYGGTTTFEVFRPSWNDFAEPNDPLPNNQCGIISLCHPWGAGPVKWLNEEVLGIKPSLPGFKTFNIIPHMGTTLKSVSGKTPTPYGDICASYDLNTGLCSFSCPQGITGTVAIPKAGKTVSKIFINGKLAWENVYHITEGVGGAFQDSEYIYFTDVQEGNYVMIINYNGYKSGYIEPPVAYNARFVMQDSITQGDWGRIYGNEGYVLCNYDGNGNDKRFLPSYVKSINYFRAFPVTREHLPDNTTWKMGTKDIRALSSGSKNKVLRNATSYTNNDNTMTVTIEINGTRDYQVALYFVDWKDEELRQAVEMFDANTLEMIAPVQLVDSFSGGKYLVYTYNKSSKFRIDKVRGKIITLGGIFFDRVDTIPCPIFHDPFYHGSADPEIVWNEYEKEWWIFYTGRRALRDEGGTAAACPIGVAASKDWKNWRFVGYCSFDGTGGKPDAPFTFWAPGIIRDGNTYHMFVTFKPGTEGYWGGNKWWIKHYAAPSDDLLSGWKVVEESLKSVRSIDASLYKKDNKWFMWTRTETDSTRGIIVAESSDLNNWEIKGLAKGDINNKSLTGYDYQEAPYVFYWKGKYWMITDPTGSDVVLYESDDIISWKFSGKVLMPGENNSCDTGIPRHPSVCVIGDRAFIFYHVEPYRNYEIPYPENDLQNKKIFLHMTELYYGNGKPFTKREKSVIIPYMPVMNQINLKQNE